MRDKHPSGHLVGNGPASRAGRRWRILLAHDTTASSCDLLIDTIKRALGNVDVSESSSVDGARVALDAGRFDLAMVCLDLPPAPRGGVALALELVGGRRPVILVTRSLRWIPQMAAALRELPWITPDAVAAQVTVAVGAAMVALRRIPDAPAESGPRLVSGEDEVGLVDREASFRR